jgi:hypothetical protein
MRSTASAACIIGASSHDFRKSRFDSLARAELPTRATRRTNVINCRPPPRERPASDKIRDAQQSQQFTPRRGI